jgi:SAM-dependent methyltransferase
MTEIEKEKAYWESHLSSRLDSLSMKRIADLVKAEDPKNKRFGLEIGCGEGRLLTLLPNLVGSDFSILGLKHGADGRKLLVCADACKLPFEDQSLDFVVTNCLHHMPYLSVLAEVRRILRDGGSFYCFEPNRWHISNLLFNRSFGSIIVGDRGFFPHRLRADLKKNSFFPKDFQFLILNLERIRFRTRIQRIAQKIPSRLFQAWFFLRAVRERPSKEDENTF